MGVRSKYIYLNTVLMYNFQVIIFLLQYFCFMLLCTSTPLLYIYFVFSLIHQLLCRVRFLIHILTNQLLSGLGSKEDSDGEYEQFRQAFILKNSFSLKQSDKQTGYKNIFLFQTYKEITKKQNSQTKTRRQQTSRNLVYAT